MTELNQMPACSKPLLSPVRVFHGDCLEIMKSIPNGSIDMVLCDLPCRNVKLPKMLLANLLISRVMCRFYSRI